MRPWRVPQNHPNMLELSFRESRRPPLIERAKDEEKPFLEQLLQEGARKLLQAAIENEVIDYIQFHKDRRGENGRRMESSDFQVHHGQRVKPIIDRSLLAWLGVTSDN
jgi:hypothetical protein